MADNAILPILETTSASCTKEPDAHDTWQSSARDVRDVALRADAGAAAICREPVKEATHEEPTAHEVILDDSDEVCVCWWETPVPRNRKLTRAVTGLAVGAMVW
mmetsp:Transcript_43880/g.81961  ORF Transcript_43880/g.81961 Transcript_43880/m.81961 type:complete len:104 (-) Transcript_43880:32-343(-)